MNFAARFFGHLHTINMHRRKVIVNCFRAGIPIRGLLHDLSKYSPTEFWNGVKYFQGMRSPNEAEREDIGYSRAWMHHKGRNRHHFEFWTDYDPVTRLCQPVKMPVSSPLQYFLKGKQRRIIHSETSDLLEGWLTLLAEQGEEAVFAEIRREIKQQSK